MPEEPAVRPTAAGVELDILEDIQRRVLQLATRIVGAGAIVNAALAALAL